MSSIKRLERKQYIISILLVIFIDIFLDLVLKDGFFKNFIEY